uniref:Uncharacterized protein n=1 Tax=Amphilophus citrinellus TaxID=61819 RepID=A0A3Q0R1C9_AMPCI
MVPFSVIDLSQQVQVSIQHLNGKKIHLARILALLLPGFAMAEKHQPIGFRRPEVKRDGSRLLRCPLAQRHVGLWGVKGHGV